MVNKGNHPQMALIQAEESLVGPLIQVNEIL